MNFCHPMTSIKQQVRDSVKESVRFGQKNKAVEFLWDDIIRVLNNSIDENLLNILSEKVWRKVRYFTYDPVEVGCDMFITYYEFD